MNLSLAGWSLIGIGAAILIALGIGLLVVYALRRGLHNSELEGMDAEPGGTPEVQASVTSARGRDSTRTIGGAGAAVLVLGLALGVIAATGGWGTQQAQGPGMAPEDCAQAWNGCPQATVAP